MTTTADLEAFLGKDIKDICGNGFGDANLNHCAHFVSHATGLTFSFNCAQMTGGHKPPGNIRVHEVFAQCPRVGKWDDADLTQMQLVFVTRKDVVNLATKTMQNIPQKHIGVYSDGYVYNYSNTNDRVVKQTIPDFLARFQAIYSGDQGLFFGEIPGSDLHLAVDLSGESVAAGASFNLRNQGKQWLATRTDTPAESEFYVGNEVMQPAKNFFGLFHPIPSYYGPVYDATKYVATLDQWAYLLDVTASCESKLRFNLINTYDRARFTFGFYQLAAHTPDDNLIVFFRAALLNAEFQALFPDLKLKGGKVFRVAQDGTETDLEEQSFDAPTGEMQLKNFMAYLNPERTLIDRQEILQAARVVWWGNSSTACADTQVNVANAILQRKMSTRYAIWYDLDGETDVVCAIVADIHHQGRASKATVRNALATANKVKALLQIGKADYPERIATLTSRIDKWTTAGAMGTKRYQAALNEFQ
jgi:hypothetical protein